ncbi:Glutathione S-transferase omega-1 [Smittium culicis]|uniref:Glutathione S-transferase omega-1 n=3 Tax=Smittium culicis TaxID=133412 RepID=A0A1R1XQA1_9FUNG|nr:Glutathione S-transferase omega-1 [Smittium culicis]
MAQFNPDKPTLYSSRICPFAQRAVIAMTEAGIDYEDVFVDLFNKPDWYSQIHPQGLVPAVRLPGGKALTESQFIVYYAADINEKLYPKTPVERYDTRQLMDYIDKKVMPNYYKIMIGPVEDVVAVREDMQIRIRELNEKLLEINPDGIYVHGDSLTIADIYLLPLIQRYYLGVRKHCLPALDETGLERFIKWKKTLFELASFKKSFDSEDDIWTALSNLKKRLDAQK